MPFYLIYGVVQSVGRAVPKHPGAPLWNEVDSGLGKCRGLEKLVCKLEWLVGFRDVRLFVFPQPVAKE